MLILYKTDKKKNASWVVTYVKNNQGRRRQRQLVFSFDKKKPGPLDSVAFEIWI